MLLPDLNHGRDNHRSNAEAQGVSITIVTTTPTVVEVEMVVDLVEEEEMVLQTDNQQIPEMAKTFLLYSVHAVESQDMFNVIAGRKDLL